MRNAKAVWHKNDDAVSPVIGTILMVAITVVLAAVLWLMVSGMLTSSDETKITVNLQSPTVNAVTRTVVFYDATMSINKITPKEEKVLWTEVRMVITSSSGSVLLNATGLSADDPPNYGAVTPAVIKAWFVETTTGDTKMSAGDSIKITGMTTDYEGAKVQLTKAGERIAEATLPTNFD
jgi:flagellin-like protein